MTFCIDTNEGINVYIKSNYSIHVLVFEALRYIGVLKTLFLSNSFHSRRTLSRNVSHFP